MIEGTVHFKYPEQIPSLAKILEFYFILDITFKISYSSNEDIIMKTFIF